jgi:hypothetical protein
VQGGAAVKITARIEGFEALQKRLNRLDLRVLVAVEELLQATGKAVSRGAKSRLSGRGVRTGKYKRSIKSRFDKAKQAAIVGPMVGKRKHPLLHLLERGHKIRNRASGPVLGRVDGIPHLATAWDAEKEAMLRGLRKIASDL